MEGHTPLRNLSRHNRRAAAIVASAGLVAAGLLVSSPTSANPGVTAPEDAPSADRPQGGHEPKHPLKIKEKRDAQKAAALERIAAGKAPFKASAKGANQEVPLELEGTDKIFVVLAEFGDTRYEGAGSDECGPGCFTDTPPFTLPNPKPTTFDGPLHNEIPKPDRATDNSTIWQPNFDRAHYEDMYFNRMKEYYETQSSGRYSIDGDVTEWVKVPYNQALYGRGFCGNPPGAAVTTCASTKALVRDAMAVWVDNQLKSGQTMPEIVEYLKTFDVQDRYDSNGNGNYNEPDGFIDHFQIVHAGGDEAAGDPIYGSDAIWSHRWYSNLQKDGPGGLTGVNIGSNGGAYGLGETAANPVPNNPTGIWVGDYTIQPENGGLGVFAHEYAHDLGLPDLYDTSGNTGGAENSTAFWTLMSSGSNIGDGGDTIGDAPTDMGAWELFQLGWLDAQGDQGPFYEVVRPGEKSTVRLGKNVPATNKAKQAIIATLPDKEVPLELGAPAPDGGTKYFWSDQGDNLNNTMTKTGITGTDLTASVRYDIEEDWDYAFLEASTDGGTTWTPVTTNLSDTSGDQSGFNTSLTGITGTTATWSSLTATLPAGTNAVRFRYQTDGAFVLSGFQVDNINVGGTVIGTAENENEGWTFDGFRTTTGSEIQEFFNAYIAENRQYDGYDTSLASAYNFSFPVTKPDLVETYPYQNGMLINYWDSSQADNNVGDHPGEGLILPVDANPQFGHWSDKTLLRPRILSYDSTFSLERTDAITLKREVDINKDGKITGAELESASIASKPANPLFDDTRTYWFNSDEHGATGSHPGRYQPGWYSVDVPKTGTTLRVTANTGDALVVKVGPKK
ncbi:M6 family metalloprotease domain-containing protein [Nocardioides glacieisoli]|uniref:M6 family metalloprotease domain-containing protein n=1 Tax=Nocardioides glacieisoli TaxID=1168730 RepID=A0A4Q2S366_9ACTN|nr:immune inhibitor A domain-containing protein [Nocardioides glacieisoli]RYB96170.1 M6 family metalloprotease domain-containing protein [Nocardioides glacieisoli]